MSKIYSPKIVTDSLVMCLDASQNKSYPTTDLPVKGGLLLWLDAADDSTFSYSSGTEVSQWRDKSGNNFHANQATVGNQPSRNTVVNSRKSVNFSSANADRLRVNSGMVFTNSVTAIVFIKPGTQNFAYADILDQDHAMDGYNGWVIQRNNTASQWLVWLANEANTTWLNTNAVSYADNTPQIVTLRKGSSTLTLSSNGTSSGDVAVADQQIRQANYFGLNIGTWRAGNELYASSRHYNGEICEIVVYNRALSLTELKQVHTYLGQKWGISNTDRSIIDLSENDDNGLLGAGTAAYMPVYDYYNKGSLRFDGSDDYVDLGTNAALTSLTNNITVEAWIKIPISTNRYTIYGNGYSGTGMMFGTSANTPGGLEVYYPTIFVAYSTAGVLQPDVWQHVVYTRNGSGLNTHAFYINGVSQTVTQTANGGDSWGTSGTNRYLGLRGGVMFNGQMSSAKVYSRALSAAEVAQNYEAQKSRFANTIVQQGLVLNLDAGNPYSYAGAGSTWYDVSGNNLNGIILNNPTFEIGTPGSVVFSNVSTQVISIPDSSILKPASVTLSAWVYVTQYNPLNDFDGQFPSILWKCNDGNSGGAASYGLSLSSGQFPRFTVTPTVLISSTACPIATWVYLVGVYTVGGSQILYRNGVVDISTTGPSTITYSSQVVSIGSRIFSGTYQYPWNGKISNVTIHNRALSATEVLQNYNATKGRFGL